MLKKVRKFYLEYRRQKALRNIRAFFVAFGQDVSDLTDEEIEKMCERLHSTVKRIGFTLDEAKTGIDKLAKFGAKV